MPRAATIHHISGGTTRGDRRVLISRCPPPVHSLLPACVHLPAAQAELADIEGSLAEKRSQLDRVATMLLVGGGKGGQGEGTACCADVEEATAIRCPLLPSPPAEVALRSAVRNEHVVLVLGKHSWRAICSVSDAFMLCVWCSSRCCATCFACLAGASEGAAV